MRNTMKWAAIVLCLFALPTLGCDDDPSSLKPIERCGDGVKTGTEQCDDKNTVSGDGCSEQCVRETGYVCVEDDNGKSRCTLEESAECGNKVREAPEGCDDGNKTLDDGCDAECHVEEGYECAENEKQKSICQLASNIVCGDDKREGDEACDDGNTEPNDGCDAKCRPEKDYTCTGPVGGHSVCTKDSIGSAECGNAIREDGEACDDGNKKPNDGCDAECNVEDDWTCSGDLGAQSTCYKCGDGERELGEECDDGDKEPNDGCSPECTVEPNWNCEGEIGEESVCEEITTPLPTFACFGFWAATCLGSDCELMPVPKDKSIENLTCGYKGTMTTYVDVEVANVMVYTKKISLAKGSEDLLPHTYIYGEVFLNGQVSTTTPVKLTLGGATSDEIEIPKAISVGAGEQSALFVMVLKKVSGSKSFTVSAAVGKEVASETMQITSCSDGDIYCDMRGQFKCGKDKVWLLEQAVSEIEEGYVCNYKSNKIELAKVGAVESLSPYLTVDMPTMLRFVLNGIALRDITLPVSSGALKEKSMTFVAGDYRYYAKAILSKPDDKIIGVDGNEMSLQVKDRCLDKSHTCSGASSNGIKVCDLAAAGTMGETGWQTTEQSCEGDNICASNGSQVCVGQRLARALPQFIFYDSSSISPQKEFVNVSLLSTSEAGYSFTINYLSSVQEETFAAGSDKYVWQAIDPSVNSVAPATFSDKQVVLNTSMMKSSLND